VKHAFAPQYVGNQVVGEDRQAIEIFEGARPTTPEGRREVGAGDLGPFVEGHLEARRGR